MPVDKTVFVTCNKVFNNFRTVGRTDRSVWDGVVLCSPECLGHPGHTPSFRPNHGSSQPLLSGIVQCMDTFNSKCWPKEGLRLFF